jgi:hypothetical protein
VDQLGLGGGPKSHQPEELIAAVFNVQLRGKAR